MIKSELRLGKAEHCLFVLIHCNQIRFVQSGYMTMHVRQVTSWLGQGKVWCLCKNAAMLSKGLDRLLVISM